MPARPVTEIPSLTDADVAALRQRVIAGETPRVVVRSASAAVPSGTRGSVVRIGDPSQDEYVVVRIKRDEVPFSPSELSMPGAKPVPVAPRPSRPRRSSVVAPSVVATPVVALAEPQTKGSTPVTRRSSRAPARTPARRSRTATKSLPPLTVTLRFADGDWAIEANRGARRLARPTSLKPGAVSALAEHVDDEGVRSALVETVEACRAVVEQRAAELRAQLVETEAALRDYESRARKR